MQNASFHFTKVTLDYFFAQACTKVKVWMINHPTTLGFWFFSIFFFAFPFSLLPVFMLKSLAFYQASFEYKDFRESVDQARNTCTCHGQAKGGKGKFTSEFFLF